MVISTGSKELLRRVLRNQHKLRQFLRQQIRLCSNVSLQQAQEAQKSEETAVNFKTIASEYTTECLRHPVQHEPDVGRLFSASELKVQLAAPHQLQPKPDVDEMIFGKNFTDHMLKIYHHTRLGGWQEPQITPMENLVIHPASKVLHYAVELFEGTKAYRGEDGRIRLFRPDMNMRRMNISAKRAGLPTFDSDEFIKCLCRLISIDQEWVPHTSTGSLYIRPTLIGIDPTLGVAASESALLYTILSPVGAYFKSNTSEGISLLADPRFTRAWPGGVGDRKMGSNYAPTLQVQKEAAKKGLQHVLWLYGEDHQLTEVGIMNIFMVYINDTGEKEMITPPLNGLILPGITRDSILTLGKQMSKDLGGLVVKEGKFTMPMVCKLLKEGRLLELFGAGTACLVNPIKMIHYLGENIDIPTLEHKEPVYRSLRTALTDIQYGKVKHPWTIVVE